MASPRRTARLVPIDTSVRQAAHALERLLSADAARRHGASLKSLTLAPHIRNKRAVHAITVETLKHLPVLERSLEGVPPTSLNRLGRTTALVLVREMILGHGLRCGNAGPAELEILRNEQGIRDAYRKAERMVGKEESSGGSTIVAEKLLAARARTARVNQVIISVEDALQLLAREEAHEAQSPPAVHRDEHLPDVLCFPPGTDLHDHPLVQNGSLVLQGKSSCMPARALRPQYGWKILDACAAPGNKTTHLASLLHEAFLERQMLSENQNNVDGSNRGHILALDKDSGRLKRLRENVNITKTGCLIDARCIDFLSIDPHSPEYRDVDAILLDPSCSGSGTRLSRMDYLLPSSASVGTSSKDDDLNFRDERVSRLVEFQTRALRLALDFPSVQRIVYSTCSVHIAENENVVATVLNDAMAKGFALKPALPAWPRRGIAGRLSEENATAVVRVDPLDDGTDGFFVALFERMSRKKAVQRGKE